MNIDELIPPKVVTKQGITVKIGLANRTNYDLTVEFSNKNDTVILPPNYRSSKEFVRNSIVSVNGISLREAISKGLVSIIN